MRYAVVQLIIFICVISIYPQVQPKFEDYFSDQTMRIDYFHIGDIREEFITLDRIPVYIEPL